MQNLSQNWVLTTLGHSSKSDIEKRVIYAFPTLKDASLSISENNVVAIPIPVIHILFQIIAIQTLDSLLFFEKPGDLVTATEVKREDVQKYIMLIKYYVKQGLNNVIPCNCIRFWVLCYFKDYGNQGYVKPGPTVISIK